MVVSYLTSLMSITMPSASLVPIEPANPDGNDAHCDENGTWLRQDNGSWQLVAPALTSLAVG